MADIRIKDLAVTASASSSDDYLAVDGSTNGTRKLNAYSPTFGGNVVATGTLTVNSTTDSSSKDTGAIVTEGGLGVEKSASIGGNLTVGGTITSNSTVTATDYLLGASGPSVKSAVNARGLAQGVVLNGTAGVSFSGVGALRTNLTAAWTMTPKTLPAYSTVLYGSAGCLYIYYASDGNMVVQKEGSSIVTTSGGGEVVAGETQKWAFTYDGTTAKLYKEGKLKTSATVTVDFTGSNSIIGWTGSSEILDGAVSQFVIYNRALTADQVKALMVSGVDQADVNKNVASNTNLVTNGDFASSSGWTAEAGWAVSGGKGVATSAADGKYLYRAAGLPVAHKTGERYRIEYTISGYSSGSVKAYVQGSASTARSADGTYSEEVTITSGNLFEVGFLTVGTTSLSVDDLKVYALGAVLYPEPEAPGNGLVWNDMSGNGNHIVLPTSGVSWAKPSNAANRIRGTTSTNGNQQLLGASVLLPAECQITHVRARARSGTPTITIGTASGGAQIVASVALSTTWLNCTIALTGGIVSSADDIWVGSNSTDVVETDIAFQPLDF